VYYADAWWINALNLTEGAMTTTAPLRFVNYGWGPIACNETQLQEKKCRGFIQASYVNNDPCLLITQTSEQRNSPVHVSKTRITSPCAREIVSNVFFLFFFSGHSQVIRNKAQDLSRAHLADIHEQLVALHAPALAAAGIALGQVPEPSLAIVADWNWRLLGGWHNVLPGELNPEEMYRALLQPAPGRRIVSFHNCLAT
jgi:hypothetical protein